MDLRIGLCLGIVLALCAVVQATAAAEEYTVVGKWGKAGAGGGYFFRPEGIAIDGSGWGGSIYVADTHLHRIQKFAWMGFTFLSKWGSDGYGDGQFHNPSGIAVSNDGNLVYVTDTENDRVEVFGSAGGACLAKWGSGGTGPGQFDQPEGIAVDGAGNIYVVDSRNHRVQKFNSKGQFVKKWGYEGVGYGNFRFGGIWNGPSGIAVDGEGNVYVVDTGNNRVQKFTSEGGFIWSWGSKGASNGTFSRPNGIAVDTAGNVYVADFGNNRVQKFTSLGTYITKWGSLGAGDGQFNGPVAIAVDDRGCTFVVDEDNNRVQVFQLPPEASFTAAPPSGIAPLTVQFTDTSTKSPAGWQWDFGDGSVSSTEQNPVHTYANPGTYTVTLTARKTFALDSTTQSISVVAATPSIDVEASVSVDGGATWHDADAAPGPHIAPGSIVQWQYTVENTGNTQLSSISFTGVLGTTVNLPMTSLAAGKSMTVTASSTAIAGQFAGSAHAAGTYVAGGRTVTDRDDVHYYGVAPVAAAFTATPQRGAAPLMVQFTDTSTVGLTSWSWTFGDGTTDTAVNPSHTYDDPGTYTVTLTVTRGAESASTTKTITVYYPPPSIDVEASVSVDGGSTWHDADTAPGPSVNAGSPVQWKYVVTNLGGADISSIRLMGVLGAPVTLPKTSLAYRESTTATVSSTAVAGQFDGSAIISGRWPFSLFRGGPVWFTVTDSDDVYYNGIGTADRAPVLDEVPAQSVDEGGSLSFTVQATDPDGDPVTYAVSGLPENAGVELDPATGAFLWSPGFDRAGTYSATFTATSGTGEGALSDSRAVTITVINVNRAPVAYAGPDQSLEVPGALVTLDGSGSYDEDGDPLAYAWTLRRPSGSAAVLADETSVSPTFVADRVGEYTVELVVSDGQLTSDPSLCEIQVVARETQVIADIQDAEASIAALDPAVFTNPNMQNALINKLNEVLADIGSMDPQEAINKLNEVLAKTDGCVLTGAPDKNDWIEDCSTQHILYAQIQAIIDAVGQL